MCFSLEWFEQVLIWLVIIGVVVALLKLIAGFVLPKVGFTAEVLAFIVAALRIFIWGIICIALIIFVFDLISCFLHGGIGFPRLPR